MDPTLIPPHHFTELAVAWGLCASVLVSAGAAAVAFVNTKIQEMKSGKEQ
jgi:hypothetical protein